MQRRRNESSSHGTNDASQREKSCSREHEKGNREMSAVESQHHRHAWNAKHFILVAVACFALIEMFRRCGEIGFCDFHQPQEGMK